MIQSQLSSTLFPRTAQTLLVRYATIYPAVVINGPRQSGKTTLAQTTFPHLPYVSLENLDTQLSFTKDPRQFLAYYQHGAIFDEVQHTPTLLSYLQEIIDSSSQNGRFIITGSQNFTLNSHITQSLAGRVGTITLLPLSAPELGSHQTPNSLILSGGYPRLHKNHMTPLEFYPSYINSYIERDVRQLKNIQDLSTFKIFTQLCAGRTGQLLNINTLAQEAGIDHKTAQAWLSVLEASYIIFLLRPYYKNFNKRLTKSPKLYFYDTGLAAALLTITTEQQLAVHFARGALFENLIITELLKKRCHAGIPPQLSFWNESSSREIDVIDYSTGVHHLIEIKSGHTAHPADSKHLETLAPLFPNAHQWIVYGAPQRGVLGHTKLLSLETLDALDNGI
jgi:predicted AAA+ superfamily ATPase